MSNLVFVHPSETPESCGEDKVAKVYLMNSLLRKAALKGCAHAGVKEQGNEALLFHLKMLGLILASKIRSNEDPNFTSKPLCFGNHLNHLQVSPTCMLLYPAM